MYSWLEESNNELVRSGDSNEYVRGKYITYTYTEELEIIPTSRGEMINIDFTEVSDKYLVTSLKPFIIYGKDDEKELSSIISPECDENDQTPILLDLGVWLFFIQRAYNFNDYYSDCCK